MDGCGYSPTRQPLVWPTTHCPVARRLKPKGTTKLSARAFARVVGTLLACQQHDCATAPAMPEWVCALSRWRGGIPWT
jgi:hypothetical protein